jgi:ELWxxDGT repeat protein
MRLVPAVLSLALLLAPPTEAQQQVANINLLPQPSGSMPLDSSPQGFVATSGRLYFSATTAATGREYFWTDGVGSPQLLADVSLGTSSSDPADLVELPGGTLLFTARTPGTGREVWVSDGTAAGTSMLVELTTDDSTSPLRLTVHAGAAYFLAREQNQFSPSLWRTDGTTAGTVKIEDLGLTGGYANAALQMASTNSLLYYTSAQTLSGGSHWRLYATDGSVGGATLVRQVSTPSGFGVRELTGLDSRVVFVAEGQGTGLEPWVSDGTSAGTQIVELVAGSNGSNPGELTRLGNRVLFTATTVAPSRAIFASDGTVAGTYQATMGSPSDLAPLWLSAANGLLFYAAGHSGQGLELWATDGTAGQEFLYAEFTPGAGGSDPRFAVPFGGGIVCQATVPGFGTELFFSAGTPLTTSLLEDVNPGVASSNPTGLTAFGSRVYFAATSPFTGLEPWVADPSGGGVSLLADLAPVSMDQGSVPRDFANLGDRAVFVADDGVHGRELWVSDGTGAGTQRLTGSPAPGSSFGIGPVPMVPFGGRAIFPLDDGVHGQELWISDGTVAGTQLIVDLAPGSNSPQPAPLTVWRGELYFAASVFPFGVELWATDGTAAGTRLVRDIEGLNFGSSWPSAAVAHGDHLYFSAQTTTLGRELWRTDGTALGTELVVDLVPGTGSGVALGQAGVSIGSYLYFPGQWVPGDVEVMRTDGTAQGTSLVANVNPTGNGGLGNFFRFGDRFVFSAFVNGDRQYWGCDGTSVEQLSFPPLFLNSNWLLYATAEKLITVVRGAGNSFELWGTDGTAAGSGVIVQIHPDGSLFTNLRAWHVTSGSHLVFLTGTAPFGEELYVTDGTAGGSHVLYDFNPGPADFSPDNLVRVGDLLLFNGNDGDTGWELYSLPLGFVGEFVAKPFGLGCPGSNGLAPAIEASGSAGLGDTLTVELSDAAPGSVAGHYWSPAYGRSQVGSCSLYLAAPAYLAATFTDGQGASTLPLAVPNVPALAGAQLWLQSVIVDPGAALLGLASLSPALEVIVGP